MHEAVQSNFAGETDERINDFLRHEIPTLQKVSGLRINVATGKGWTTDMHSGSVTVDPAFFIEKGYTTDHSIYATLHEILAHVRDVRLDPVYAKRQNDFSQQGPAQHIFDNIMTDIIGNRRIHNLLPRQAEVAEGLYREKLFPEDDYTKPQITKKGELKVEPRHLQFLYKIMRQEMIPGSVTFAAPEVDAEIAELRDFEGSGVDVIEFLTNPNNPEFAGVKGFDTRLATIYEAYKRLLELDREDKKDEDNKKKGDGKGDKSSGGKSEDGTPEQGAGNEPSDEDMFGENYEDYFENRDMNPLSPEEQDKLDEAVAEAAREQAERRMPAQQPKVGEAKRREVEAETGVSYQVYQEYMAKVEQYAEQIRHMREVFKSVIDRQLHIKKGIGRRAYTEGDTLNPDRLTQTFIDIQAGQDPEAYARYENVHGRADIVGNTDYVFCFDCSGSMGWHERAKNAADSAVILLEALAGMERDIQETEREHGIELELDIRTAVYTFTERFSCTKPLSGNLSDKERVATYNKILHPDGGNSEGFLEEVNRLPAAQDRRKILMILTDGDIYTDGSKTRGDAIVRELEAKGWIIYSIGVSDDAVPENIGGKVLKISDPTRLPGEMVKAVEETIV